MKIHRHDCSVVILVSGLVAVGSPGCLGTPRVDDEATATAVEALLTSPIPLDGRSFAIIANTGSVHVGSGARVDSYASSSGPYGGSNVGQRGSVRAATTITTSGTGIIQGNRVSDSPAQLAIVPVPAGARNLPLGASAPGSVNINTLGQSITLRPGSYVVNNLNVNFPGEIRIQPVGQVNIWVKGTLNLGGNENPGGVPGNLAFLVNSAGFVNVNANGKLFGSIYAPLSVVSVNSQVFGNVVGSSVNVNSGGAAHFDTLLAVACAADADCNDDEPCTTDTCDPAIGCQHFVDAGCQQCPIDWAPSARAPVFDGAKDFGPAEGAPGPVRIVFPTLDGNPFQARMLLGCEHYPIVLLAHGNCAGDPQHFKAWYRGASFDEVAVGLARSGFVVVIPDLPQTRAGTQPPWAATNSDLQRIADTLTWVRTQWDARGALITNRIGILGHSWGAMLGARFAQESAGSDNAVTAYAGLSGTWSEWDAVSRPRPIDTLAIPKLFTWGAGSNDVFADLDQGGFWSGIPPFKHRAAFQEGGHFDYLSAAAAAACQGNERGPCSETQTLAREQVLTFFSNYMPPDGQLLSFPDSMLLPPLTLTDEQELFAGRHRVAEDHYLDRASENPRVCSASFNWNATSSGMQSLPP